MAAAEMLVCRGERWRRGLFALVFLCYVHFSRAADVSPPEELFVENGTQARLPCNFKSMESSSIQQSVTWRFKPDSGSDPVTIFYYSSGTSYPPNAGQFKDRISWASDLTRKDASIKVNNMQFKDNGTYTCSVVTLPDLGSMTKEIRLKVVEKENLPLSNGPLLIGIICAVISALLIIASIIFAICIYKKKKSRKNYTGCSTTDSLMAQIPVKQPPRKSPSDTEVLVTHIPSGAIQGPVIYAQLDHSGKTSNQIYKSERVVYSDIRKIC
ncbi:myelin protein zero-like protein 1 isoform X1 [Xenopus laevis]|uniref:Myelin protein P0 n=1 Tax=Xenopus laevis TaxID=8355 RepID=A0A8J1M6R6_XENLA|nr:myelin protein zero-like protein 1 isoform X1 [Xenopus laevis]